MLLSTSGKNKTHPQLGRRLGVRIFLLLQQGHEEMLRLAESFTEEELFTKGYYKVTYTTSMAAYFLSVVPYGQAVKILKAHQKNLKKK